VLQQKYREQTPSRIKQTDSAPWVAVGVCPAPPISAAPPKGIRGPRLVLPTCVVDHLGCHGATCSCCFCQVIFRHFPLVGYVHVCGVDTLRHFFWACSYLTLCTCLFWCSLTPWLCTPHRSTFCCCTWLAALKPATIVDVCPISFAGWLSLYYLSIVGLYLFSTCILIASRTPSRSESMLPSGG
jgi:hypothetical protein